MEIAPTIREWKLKLGQGNIIRKYVKTGKIEVNWHIQTIWIQKSLGQVHNS